LITGINGQDGSFLAKKALDHGFEVIGLQRPHSSQKKEQEIFRLKELEIFDRVDLKIVDLNNLKQVEDLFREQKPEYFVHLGSQSNVKNSFKYKVLTKESNIDTTKNIVDTIEKFSKETIFFFPSSATIYEGYKNTQVNESTNPLPKTYYAKSKLVSQEYIVDKIRGNDLQLNNGIMFSHESEYRKPNFFSKKITQFLVDYKFCGNKNLKVGNLIIERDIGYAKEYVDAIFKIIKANNRQNYIVSSNKLYKLSDLINECLDILEINYEIVLKNKKMTYIDKKSGFEFITSEDNEFRKYDLIGIKGNNSKIIRDLNWEPKIQLKEISKIMINYELKNKK